MKLTIPVSDINDISFAKKMGVTDVYGGFIDNEINVLTSGHGIYNGRTEHTKGHFNSLSDLKIGLKIAKSFGIKFNFIFNILPPFGNDNYLKIAINNTIDLDYDAIILSDYKFINSFNKKNKKIIISTFTGLYNTEVINYYLNNYSNIKRIIFPRELSIKEKIEIINKNSNISYEMLIFNDWCYKNNSVCSSIHSNRSKYLCNKDKNYYSKYKAITNNYKEIYENKLSCKVCIMYNFKGFKNIYFKVAGRSINKKKLQLGIIFSKIALDNIKKVKNNKDYIKQNIMLHKKIFGKKCGYKKCEIFNEYIN